MSNFIIKEAREHNLKDLDVEIPQDKLVVIADLSASGSHSPNKVRPFTILKCRLFLVRRGNCLTRAVAAIRASDLSREGWCRRRSEYRAAMELEMGMSRQPANSERMASRSDSRNPGLVRSSFWVTTEK